MKLLFHVFRKSNGVVAMRVSANCKEEVINIAKNRAESHGYIHSLEMMEVPDYKPDFVCERRRLN